MNIGDGMNKEPPPPFRRRARNVWVTTQRGTELPNSAAGVERVFAALDEVILAFQKVALQQGAQLRLITGIADDIDAKAAEIAGKYGCDWHVVAPEWPAEAAGRDEQPDRVALITQEPGRTAPDAVAAADAAADEARLGFADAVVVVCHGAPLSSYAAERDRILVEALCRHTPMVWIEVSEEGAGAAWFLRPQALDELAVTTLGKDPEQVRRVGTFFSRVALGALVAEVAELLAIHWSVARTLKIDDMLRQRFGDPGKRATWHGMFYTSFLRLFGRWRVKLLSPVRAQRGPPALVGASQFPPDTWEWFDRIDRAATYAAYSHRDQVVVVNLFSSFAVFAAVAGQAWLDLGPFWGRVEMALLILIAWVVYRNRHRSMTNHDRWLHFRQAAEALRLSALLHPLLASLSLLHRNVWKYDATEAPQPVLDKPFHWLVIQLLRDAGIPGQAGRPHCIATQFHDLVESLDGLIGDQERYHERSRSLYEQTHRRLHRAIVTAFWVVLLAVAFHLGAEWHLVPAEVLLRIGAALRTSDALEHLRWPLLLTAFLPALAAAMHGIASKAELQRLAKNSERMHQRLNLLRRSIEGVRRGGDPMALRALAIETAATMYAEHDAWADLMADQPLELV